ncbi:transposase [Ruania suaedae]|uniref:transposase n=1 Tax=Ruania suaedae TaxID=2897774 RepID=UPI001E651FFE|nr:transposase [Ruania suaedae]UFU02548.1 transposase [Ruania suaedae]
MPKKFDSDVRAEAVRRLQEAMPAYRSRTAAVAAVAREFGVGHESLRRWYVQDARPGSTSQGQPRVRLEEENRRLREEIAILRAAASYFLSERSSRREVDGTAEPLWPPRVSGAESRSAELQ